MITPTIRAALGAFRQAANRGTAVYLSPELVKELRDALNAEPEGEGPSVEEVYYWALKSIRQYGSDTLSGRADGGADDREWQRAAVAEMVRRAQEGLDYGTPVAQPAPEPGEVRELVEFLTPSREQAGAISLDAFVKLRRAAALLQQQSTELATLRAQPVAVSDRLPEPNTKVLAHYCNKLSKGRTICAIWVPAKTRVSNSDIDENLDLEYDDKTDQFYWPEGWYEAIENWEEFGYLKVYEGEVAYWQPLPKWPANAISLPAPQAGEGEA